MARDILFLLKPGFFDGAEGPFYCPESAEVNGVMQFFPELKDKLDVRFVDFPRPRREIVELIGEENQSCPVLVLADPPSAAASDVEVLHAKGRWFVSGAGAIGNFLARVYGIGRPH